MLKGKRGKLPAAALVLALAVAATAVASAKNRQILLPDSPELSADLAISPKALPPETLSPVALHASARVEMDSPYRTYVPPLRELLVELDRNLAINVRGRNTCKWKQLSPITSTEEAISRCGKALIGRGEGTFQISIEETLVPAPSRLLIFNGGEVGNVITLYVHAYITIPTPTTIVATVRIKKINNGRYRLQAVVTVPEFLGGDGSLTSFWVTMDKRFRRGRENVGVVSAKCPDGKLQTQVEARLADSTTFHGTLVQTCIRKD